MHATIYVPDAKHRQLIQSSLTTRLKTRYCLSEKDLRQSLFKQSPTALLLDLSADEILQVLSSPDIQKKLYKIPYIIGLGYSENITCSSLKLDVYIHFTQNGLLLLGSLLDNLDKKYEPPTALEDLEIEFVGSSKNHLKMIEQAQMICNTDVHVLLTGETGTGKTAFARLIHSLSKRSNQPFMHINCASIPENLLESELFGYKKGAFTGADNDREGKFQATKKGTILLDEIGEISLFLQAKLLKVLDEKSLFALGDANAVDVKARIIAATNQNLTTAVKERRFREDLYYRLNTIEILIPPLRERLEDIDIIFDHFLGVYSKEMELRLPQVEPGVLGLLKEYTWPGNIRQLQNLIRAILAARPKNISMSNLPSYLLETPNTIVHEGMQQIQTLEWIKKTYAGQIYKMTGSNKLKTARLLGVDVKTLRKLL